MKQTIRSWIRGIKNLWRWLPIVWQDRDYDFYYIQKALHFKLKNTYYFFTSKDSVTNWDFEDQKKSLKALRICITILDRQLNDFYILELVPEDGFDSADEAKKVIAVEQRDERILGALLGKYLTWWWD
jgi:hypothetical protein